MDKFLEKDDIYIRLNKIFESKFKISIFDKNLDIDTNDCLLGEKFKLVAADLIYLVSYVEQEFGITVLDDDIDNIKFNTIKNIVSIINMRLEEKKDKAI